MAAVMATHIQETVMRTPPRSRVPFRWPLAVGALAVLSMLALAACTTVPPAGAKPVAGFDVDRYAGHWYELARIDHRFEKGLINT